MLEPTQTLARSRARLDALLVLSLLLSGCGGGIIASMSILTVSLGIFCATLALHPKC